jgi:hypothetical protein
VCEEGNNERVDGSMLDSLEVEGKKKRFIGEGKAFKVAPNACLDTNVIVISEVQKTCSDVAPSGHGQNPETTHFFVIRPSNQNPDCDSMLSSTNLTMVENGRKMRLTDCCPIR